MTVKQITDALEEFAPLEFQENYDNSGLIVGKADMQVSSALICVDVTEQVINEAISIGADMIISHHPIIFNAMKRFNSASYVERVVETAIKTGKVLYACHTNLDSTSNGMSFKLAEILGIRNPVMLTKNGPDSENGFGIVGDIEPTSTMEFLSKMKHRLGLKVVRHSDIIFGTTEKVALCTGAGASLLNAAKRSGAELYIAADFKYNDFMNADKDITIADIGHFESEYCAIDLIFDIIRKKLPNFALYKSESSRNPINYLV